MDDKTLKKLGFIQTIQGGVPYLTVAGTIFLAHESGVLVGIETERVNADDKEYLTIKATVRVLNTHLVAGILKGDLPDDLKQRMVDQVMAQGLIGTFSDYAQSPRSGGKSAEGKTPLEVATTSAVGRALRKAGMGINGSLATYDEIVLAMTRGEGGGAGVVTGPSRKKVLGERLKASGVKTTAAANKLASEKFGVEGFAALTDEQIEHWLAELDQTTADVPF